jgi:hypothetical protein
MVNVANTEVPAEFVTSIVPSWSILNVTELLAFTGQSVKAQGVEAPAVFVTWPDALRTATIVAPILFVNVRVSFSCPEIVVGVTTYT